ncbi:MAG: hypothetical protein ACOYLN_02460 [Blastocatellia bacterium]
MPELLLLETGRAGENVSDGSGFSGATGGNSRDPRRCCAWMLAASGPDCAAISPPHNRQKRALVPLADPHHPQ